MKWVWRWFYRQYWRCCAWSPNWYFGADHRECCHCRTVWAGGTPDWGPP